METEKSKKETLKLIMQSQYFLYFGVLGIFLPYFNLYCYHLGFTGYHIGILSAVRTVATIIFPFVWGYIADKYQNRRSIFILCNFLSTLAWTFFLYTSDFTIMLIISIIYGIFYSPIISFLETFSMEILGKGKKKYGKIRVWGSLNFVFIVVLTGKIIDLYNTDIIIPLILSGSLIQSFISFKIPKTTIKNKGISLIDTKFLVKKKVLVFMFCAFLMLVSHGAYYGFFSIYLEKLNFGKTFIGISWAIASAAEIIVMIKSDIIFKRFSIQNVLIFSFFTAAIRWLILYFTKSPALIIFSQLLHAITYAAFHIASLLYMDKISPKKSKTLAQAANNAITYGLGMTIGFLFNGFLYEKTTCSVMFLISSITALSAGIILLSFHVFKNKEIRL